MPSETIVSRIYYADAQKLRFVQYPVFPVCPAQKYQPESIPQIKADYKENWQIWQQLIQQVAADLSEPFAPPHIERWCNGWQVRAHFFAYFKYAQYKIPPPSCRYCSTAAA